MSQSLTDKQAALALQVVTNPHATTQQRIEAAGYSATVARVKAASTLAQPGVQRAIGAILEKAGVTEDKLAAKHAQLLEAQKDGQPDNATQARVLELGYRLYGRLQDGAGASASVSIGIIAGGLPTVEQGAEVVDEHPEQGNDAPGGDSSPDSRPGG